MVLGALEKRPVLALVNHLHQFRTRYLNIQIIRTLPIGQARRRQEHLAETLNRPQQGKPRRLKTGLLAFYNAVLEPNLSPADTDPIRTEQVSAAQCEFINKLAVTKNLKLHVLPRSLNV